MTVNNVCLDVSENTWDFFINHDDASGLTKIHFILNKNIYSHFIIFI